MNPRYTLRRHPDKYKQTKRTWCPHCGSMNVRSDEQNRRKSLAKQDTCDCLAFPHRRGSIVGCKDWEGEWTEERERDYEAMINTPRGG